MSSSTEAVVLRGGAADEVAALPAPDFRAGDWTRYGASAALGDTVTEHTLAALTTSATAAAQAQGYSVGWAEGRRRAAEEAAVEAAATTERSQIAEARREAQHCAALATLAQAADDLRAQIAASCERIEQQATELAVALTRQLMERELAATPAVDTVRRVLAVMPEDPTAQVRLAPSLASEPVVTDLAARGVRIVADPALHPGDAVVETDTQVLDLRISAAMARIEAVLR
ncbi:FliH/SctL family protein [Nocardioides dubius]|uniref:Flagellar assembly protein FliH/Type III secretion system HrpE domain-containing protein n=1 Tax=Nocardioides dubius TaxID=317019 RepID=A0ABP4ED96_9ACTN